MVVSVWAHWAYGTAWSIICWLLLVQVGLSLAVMPFVFFALVWVSAMLLLRITGIAPWPWPWGHIKYNIYDWARHSMYVGGTLLA